MDVTYRGFHNFNMPIGVKKKQQAPNRITSIVPPRLNTCADCSICLSQEWNFKPISLLTAQH